jgi:uncharacterized protein
LDFSQVADFDWDEWNKEKNWQKHKVDFRECEEAFFNKSLLILEDKGHSRSETRYFALGVTDSGRRLAIAFTLRRNRIRVISARPQSKKEREAHEKYSA